MSYHLKCRFLLAIFLALSSGLLFASDWRLSPNDTTYQILTFLFGTVSEDLICLNSSCSYLVPQLMAVLNQGFVVFSSLILSFVLLTSTASSAHEGEFLGKKLSSMATPFRLLIGSGLLIPGVTGYSQLQIIIMKCVVFGAALGNNVYTVLRNYVEDNQVTFAMENVSAGSSADMIDSIATLSDDIYECEFCYAYVQNLMNTDGLTVEDAIKWGINNNDTMNNGPLYFSCEPHFYGYAYTVDSITSITTNCSATPPTSQPPTPNVCGVWSYEFSNNDPNTASTESILTQLQLQLRQVAISDVSYLAANNYIMDYTAGRTSAEVITQSIGLAAEQFNYSYVAPNPAPSNDDNQNDWLYFPKNFYTWLQYSSSLDIPNYVSTVTYDQGLVQQTDTGPYSAQLSSALNSIGAQKYFDTTILRTALQSGSDEVADYDFVGRDGGPVTYTFTEIAKMVKNGKEPLVTLTQYGLKQLRLAFQMLLTGMVAGSLMVLAGSIWHSISPGYGSSLFMAFAGFMQSFFMAFGFLIPLGVTMGIYLPMIPIMNYTGAVIGWLMTVIEAIVAAPIIALGIMSPGDGGHLLGRAQPAFLMLIRVILGPALIVLGLVLGAKMFDIFAAYFTQVFIYGFAYVTGVADYGPWVGLIFIPYFYFYAIFMVSLAGRCYSLIYVLLDKTTTWIGGQAGGMARDMQQIVDEGRQGAEQGGAELKAQTEKISNAGAKLGKDIGSEIKAERKRQAKAARDAAEEDEP
jgi:general stress protein YciG